MTTDLTLLGLCGGIGFVLSLVFWGSWGGFRRPGSIVGPGVVTSRRETVVQDYVLTHERMRLITKKLRRDPTQRETIDLTPPALLAAHEATMSSFLGEVDQRFGGARAWMHDAGVSPEQVERLEELILE